MNHIFFSDVFCGVDLNADAASRHPQGRTSLRIHMYTGKTLFAQLMDYLPWITFTRIVDRYDGNHQITWH